jgi:hypothetical protein
VGLAEVAYQRNELDTALRHITEGITLCRQFAYTPPLATGLVTLAWLRQAGRCAWSRRQHLWTSSTTGQPLVLLAWTVRAPVAFGTTVLFFLLFS